MDTLFHMEPLERPPRPERAKGRQWGGSASRNARAVCRAMLAQGPVPCQRCGIEITKDDAESTWHAGHIEGHATGGNDKDASNFTPEHGRCNTSDGGKLGARITNGHKAEQDWSRERTLRWW